MQVAVSKQALDLMIEVYKANKDACMKKAIADAVTKVNQPSLSAVFASKYGVSAPVVRLGPSRSPATLTLESPAKQSTARVPCLALTSNRL